MGFMCKRNATLNIKHLTQFLTYMKCLIIGNYCCFIGENFWKERMRDVKMEWQKYRSNTPSFPKGKEKSNPGVQNKVQVQGYLPSSMCMMCMASQTWCFWGELSEAPLNPPNTAIDTHLKENPPFSPVVTLFSRSEAVFPLTAWLEVFPSQFSAYTLNTKCIPLLQWSFCTADKEMKATVKAYELLCGP